MNVKIPLVLFVTLTIIFAGSTFFEVSSRSSANVTSTTTVLETSTTTSNETLSVTVPSNVITLSAGDTGNWSGVAYFQYLEWNSSTPGNFNLGGVEFAEANSTSSAFSGLPCYGPSDRAFDALFVDGSNYYFNTCSVNPQQPLVVKLSSHINPQAGVLIIPSTDQVFFLVSSPNS